MLQTVYLDHNATAPLHPEVRAKVPEWLDNWGNPSSIHWAGRGPKGLLREARASVARLLGVEPLELVFTGGGSEANNLALKGICDGRDLKRNQVIISAVEHPSILKTAEYLHSRGYQIDRVPVSQFGVLDLECMREMLSERTALVSIMLANNETGHIYPVAEAARLAHAAGAVFHCDAVQGLGKIAVRPRELGVDLLTVSAHKYYALKGCGVLYARRGIGLTSLVHGGGQERGRRAGTENILGIASLGFMAAKANEIEGQAARLAALRDSMEAKITSRIAGTHVTGPAGLRLPNTSSMVIPGVDGETLLMNLDVRGFAVSTGAACSSGSPEPSPTLLAIGLSRAEAQSSLRVSFGWETQTQQVDNFVDALVEVVERLRGFKHGERFAYGL